MNKAPILLAAPALASFAVAGVALVAVTHEALDQRISENVRQAMQRKLAAIVPEGNGDNDPLTDFIEVSAPDQLGSPATRVYRVRQGDTPVALILNPGVQDSYAGPIDLLVSVLHDGTIGGVRVLSHIVTNCLIIGRAETFASKHRVDRALVDGLAVGIGFTLVLMTLGGMRELLGQGILFNQAYLLLGDWARDLTLEIGDAFHGALIAILPPWSLHRPGLLIALKNLIDQRAGRAPSARPQSPRPARRHRRPARPRVDDVPAPRHRPRRRSGPRSSSTLGDHVH